MLGLYAPQQGHIALDDKIIDASDRDPYRQLFTTIFADYYLFDDVIQGEQSIPEDASQYLERLEISHKVSIQDGKFTTTDLSTGQRKRLALINAWLEHRPVLVFDEWAADQDPTFRRIFYTELLPDLKRLGKTIIVISHDDRYSISPTSWYAWRPVAWSPARRGLTLATRVAHGPASPEHGAAIRPQGRGTADAMAFPCGVFIR